MSNSIQIVLSSNDNYIAGLAATIQSIIVNSSKKNYYVINILYTNISDTNKEKIKLLEKNKNNIDINFININDKLKSLSNKSLYTSNHISIEAYYRLFIPEIFQQYDKILYIDCDLIVRKDIAILFNESLENNICGAVLNPPNKTLKKYRIDFLGVDENKYFNSGVLLIDTKRFIDKDIKNICFDLLNNKIKTPPCWDQDLLNVACKDNIKYLDEKWNLQWTPFMFPNNYSKEVLINFKKQVYKSYILHYTTEKKPWNYINKYTFIWWFYILQTPFFKENFFILLTLFFKTMFSQENKSKKERKNNDKQTKKQ